MDRLATEPHNALMSSTVYLIKAHTQKGKVYNMQEIWKDAHNFEGLYQVSNLGRIKNSKGLIMKQRISKDGYVRIALFKNGKYKVTYVHILVAIAFIPNPHNKKEVNHIDANKSNNVVTNLEWVTRSENHYHAVKMGLKPICPTIGKHGKDNPCTKPVYQYDLSGKFIKKWSSRDEAANYYHCKPNSISRCMNGVRKSCKGYIWSRKPPCKDFT